MLFALAVITEYMRSAYGRLHDDESGQSTVEYLVITVGALVIAAAVVVAISTAVNGKLPSIKL